MKTKLYSSSAIRNSFAPLTLLLAFCMLLSAARAQGDTVTINSAEFQRMVYSAHLMTQLSEKPELDASLQVLLELNCRNPNADPNLLVSLLRETTACYRTNAPAFIRTSGSRDEILTAYLEALRQVPARTNFVPADLVLLDTFMLQREDYATASAAELIHAGNRRLLASEGELAKRQTLLDTCVGRAQGHAAFRAATEIMLWPEILVSVSDSPAQIISNTNSPLHENLTMQTLLMLSGASGDGSLTISSNQLMTLFSGETQTFWDTIKTNLAVQIEINRSHPDLLAYLTNQPAIDANAQRLTALKQGQARRIASATAAVLVQSKLMKAKEPLIKLPGQMQGVVEGLQKMTDGLAAFGGKDITKLGKIAASGNILAGGLQLLNLFTGGESAEDEIAREVGNIKTLLGDLSTNINYRFDRVDQSLTMIFDTLNERFDQIEITLDGQGRQIAHLNGDVDEIRSSLVDVQTDLHRLERHLLTYVNQLYDRGLNQAFNKYLGYESTYPDDPMEPAEYNNTENQFFTHARNNSVDGLSSPYLGRVYTPEGLYWELTEAGGGTTNRLDQNLSYLKKYLNDVLGQATAGPLPLANPRDWFVGSYAYQQLAVENPMFFRAVNITNRLDLITARGRELTSFLGNLAFASGTNINWPLYTAVQSHYVGRLTNFNARVRAVEQSASGSAFALDTWRTWSANAPRLNAIATDVLVNFPLTLPPIPSGLSWKNGLSASWTHFLALRPDGTVADYGVEPDYGSGLQPTPANATNGVAVAAGSSHSLILQQGGKVVGWGDNFFGQSNTPPNATNVVGIAAGDDHSLALRSDGTVVGWGRNGDGQATGVPRTNYPYASTGLVSIAGQTLSNVVAVAAGPSHSLALKANGTVVGWGWNGEGQATGVPNTNSPFFSAGTVTLGGTPLSNVVAIAGGGSHSLALRGDGTVVAWGGMTGLGQTNVPGSATGVVAIAASESHSLALRADGTVVSWGGLFETNMPPNATNVVAIAAGGQYGEIGPFSVALRADGTIVAWGGRFEGHTPIPTRETNVIAIAAGGSHSLGLRSDGTVFAWGYHRYDQSQATPPASAINVQAIAVGGGHSLALKADGTVIGWGGNNYGQTNPPAIAHGAVAIAAGSSHSLALKADGTIVGWGYNVGGAATGVRGGGPGFVVFEGRTLTSVVAVAAGSYHSLALRADGTVVGWGSNRDGEASGVPTPSYPYFGAGVVTRAGNNVVAIAAGESHNLALRADGTVVAWGGNFYGQTNRPAEATNVVAIAAGYNHNLALRADGTVVAWGLGSQGQTTIPTGASNVIAIAGGASHSLFLVATETGGPIGIEDPFVVRAQIPERVGQLLHGVNGLVLTNLNFGLRASGIELSGSKALLQAALELAMPYTLERDDVLRGFLYGSESLADLEASRGFLEEQNAKLAARPNARPQALTEVAVLRFQRFNERLEARLNDLAATGEPEIPRMIGQTLRQLHLLRDAWSSVPPPALEIGRATNACRLGLYGEPYAHYTIHFRDNLNVSGWSTTSITNLHNEEFVLLPMSAPQRFYGASLSAP